MSYQYYLWDQHFYCKTGSADRLGFSVYTLTFSCFPCDCLIRLGDSPTTGLISCCLYLWVTGWVPCSAAAYWRLQSLGGGSQRPHTKVLGGDCYHCVTQEWEGQPRACCSSLQILCTNQRQSSSEGRNVPLYRVQSKKRAAKNICSVQSLNKHW